MSYEIVRFRFKGENTVLQTGLTLEEAQAHCNDPETSSSTATDPEDEYGQWFDGYREE